VFDQDAILHFGVEPLIEFAVKPDPRRSLRDSDTAGTLVRQIVGDFHFKRDNIGCDAAGSLFHLGEITSGKNSVVQRRSNLPCPNLMQVVEVSGADSRPIVDRHR
jgi:hypothetical protein